MQERLTYKNLFYYLLNNGICTEKDIDNVKIDTIYSSNYHWKLTMQNQNLIVKSGYGKYMEKSVVNEHYIYEYLDNYDNFKTSLLTPTILNFDPVNCTLIYKYSMEYIDLASYYKNNPILPTSIAEILGWTLGTLHHETGNSIHCSQFLAKYQDNFEFSFPYYDYIISRMQPEKLSIFPVEGLRFLTFYQRYENLRSAVLELVTKRCNCCLIHNNLEWSRILIHKDYEKILGSKNDYSNISLMKFIDWGSFSWGEPACDLGIAVSSYLLIWLDSLIIHPSIGVKESLCLAKVPLESVSPLIMAMTKAYIKAYPKILEHHPNFLIRVIQFAGLRLIYTVLKLLESHFYFENKSIFIMEVAKNLLCQPEKSFKSVFGLGESDIISATLHSHQ